MLVFLYVQEIILLPFFQFNAIRQITLVVTDFKACCIYLYCVVAIRIKLKSVEIVWDLFQRFFTRRLTFSKIYFGAGCQEE